MKALKHWKVILVVVLVFAAGGVTGSVLTVLHFKRAFERGFDVENKTALIMRDMQRDLHLTPEQHPKIKAILIETGHKFEGSFGNAVRESGTNLVSAFKRIERELTPEQKVIFQRKFEELRVGVKKTFKVDLPAE